jgi:DUF917 family protein
MEDTDDGERPEVTENVLSVSFQNENVLAKESSDGSGRLLAIVPDLIVVLDSQVRAPIQILMCSAVADSMFFSAV